MRSQKLLALGLAFTVAVSGAYAADYYVDLNYSGTESGTETERRQCQRRRGHHLHRSRNLR